MPLQHYLPATYLAGFSTDQDPERRQRKLVVGDKKAGNLFTASASKICGINDFYTITDSQYDSQFVDKTWAYYEQGLAYALAQLVNQSLSAMTWADTLVPFIVGLLVRGPDFNKRFESRIENLGLLDINRPDNTNTARLLERQRLLAPILAAKWFVGKIQADLALITNDLGYTSHQNMQTGAVGLVVPIDPEHILLIEPCRKRFVAIGIGGQWFPIINYLPEPIIDVNGLNQSLSMNAQRFIFGMDKNIVGRYLIQQDNSPLVPEPDMYGFLSGEPAMIFEWTWHRLITALSDPPKVDGCYLYVDFINNLIKAYKHPPYNRRKNAK